jgi:NADPH:quinone reductase-like Zn-dependent oxidoreductase
MRGLVVEAFGGPDVLEARELPDPQPRVGEIVIEVSSAGVCFHDVLSRQGAMRRGMDLPRVLGHEIAGVVVAAGPEVDDFAVGDRVATTQRRSVCGACALCRSGHETLCPRREFLGHEADGGYAQLVAVRADCCAQVPDGVDDDAAAIAACAVGTGVNAVRDTGRVRLGETVLITGAGGGLGVHAIQLAVAAGARTIAATTSEEKAGRLRELGAHEVVVAADGRFAAGVKEATGGRGVDVVIDNVGGKVFGEVRRSLAPLGRWVLVGELSTDVVELNLAQIFLRGLSLHSAVSTSRAQLVDALELIARGAVRPVVSARPALADAAQVHAELEHGRVFGRAVLQVDGR